MAMALPVLRRIFCVSSRRLPKWDMVQNNSSTQNAEASALMALISMAACWLLPNMENSLPSNW
jgi:hypothetical protein